jgi:hypothetical protein
MGGSQLDCSSYNSIALLAYLELPGTGAALYAAPGPYYLMYYFAPGCAAAQHQLTLTASLISSAAPQIVPWWCLRTTNSAGLTALRI